jgi:hypothetical protein
MAMQTDVLGATCPANATTTVSAQRTRFKGLTFSATGSGTIDIKDGATTLFTYTIAGATTTTNFVPGEGVLCETSLVVTTSSGVSGVAFYG